MDDHLDIELRPPVEVAIRCIVLASLIRRLSIESLASDRSDDGLAGDAYDLRVWLQTENLWQHLDETEAAVLETDLGRLHEDDMAAIAWQVAGLASLGWTLGLASRSPVGELAQVESLLGSIPSPWDASAAWIGAAILRPEDDIAHERERAELLEWRVRVESSRRGATPAAQAEYDELIAEVAREAADAGLATVAGSDMLIDGNAASSLDEGALERLAALAEERLRALNWVCGFGDTWNQVPLDV